MLTIRAAKGPEYYERAEFARDDYYSERGEVRGQWAGRGAEALGLSGGPDEGDLGVLLDGRDPPGGREGNVLVLDVVGQESERRVEVEAFESLEEVLHDLDLCGDGRITHELNTSPRSASASEAGVPMLLGRTDDPSSFVVIVFHPSARP